jgi:small nuclear ribonucleoprotein (snRNP)-like protein
MENIFNALGALGGLSAFVVGAYAGLKKIKPWLFRDSDWQGVWHTDEDSGSDVLELCLTVCGTKLEGTLENIDTQTTIYPDLVVRRRLILPTSFRSFTKKKGKTTEHGAGRVILRDDVITIIDKKNNKTYSFFKTSDNPRDTTPHVWFIPW